MSFILFMQYLGDHVPALGALLVLMSFVAVLCAVFYKLGKHAANKRWAWDVEHMPNVIGQDIREKLEREKAILQARLAWATDRIRVLEPLGSGVIDLVKRSTEQRAAGGGR